MDNREKLIELLDDFSTPIMLLDTKLMDWNIPTQQLREAVADHLIANGVTIQKWIPVSERLPEYETPVMGWDAELRDMGIVNFIYGQFFDILDMSEVNVTHWMPLPEAPKED